MKCADCEYFRILYEPIKTGKDIWDSGLAECKKHDLVVDFTSRRKINALMCVEECDTNEIHCFGHKDWERG